MFNYETSGYRIDDTHTHVSVTKHTGPDGKRFISVGRSTSTTACDLLTPFLVFSSTIRYESLLLDFNSFGVSRSTLSTSVLPDWPTKTFYAEVRAAYKIVPELNFCSRYECAAWKKEAR